jgi:hypothetical protein
MGHTQIFAVNSAGEITPVACDASGNVVVNASLSLSGEALETTQLQVLSNVASSATSLISIDTTLSSGTLRIDPIGTTTQPTFDSTNHTKLDTINTSLSGLALEATLSSVDTKLTSGSDATLTDALQVVAYGRDNSGNLDALNVDSSGHLKITVQDEEKDVSDATPWNAQSIADGASAETASIDMTLHKHILVMGNTTNTTDPIHLKFSNDNTNFYQGDVFIYPDMTSGDFGYHLRDSPVKYVKVSKSNNSGSAETITVKTSKMKF